MDLNKICVGLIVLLAFFGVALGNMSNNDVYGAKPSTWINNTQSNVVFGNLSATIHVRVKNTADHVQYFKISQNYSKVDPNLNWVIAWTSPQASKMVDAVSPELKGDYGWKVNARQTKDVVFKINAYGLMGPEIPTWIYNKNEVQNEYWPTIPDQGIYSSWFQPNELETLNPTLDVKYWKGTFSFTLTNTNETSVSGVIRAPIVPTDSKLIASSPRATYVDKDITLNGNIAAWDVTMAPHAQRVFSYTYLWSTNPSSSSSSGAFSSSAPIANAASGNTAVPTKQTGLPYGLFVVGGILAAGGVVYARFLR